jgi:hypothetical protein
MKPDKQFKVSGTKQKFQRLQDISSGVPASSVPHQDGKMRKRLVCS